jgi:hypothetical protein
MAGTKTRNRRLCTGLSRGQVYKIEPGTPVQVNWVDIVTECHWIDKADFIKMEPIECITVGIWMEPGADCIHIASNINKDSCDGTTIPMGCILRVKVLHGKSSSKTVDPHRNPGRTSGHSTTGGKS